MKRESPGFIHGECQNNATNAILRIESERSTKGWGTVRLYHVGQSESFWHRTYLYDGQERLTSYVAVDSGPCRIVFTGESNWIVNDNDGVFTMSISRYVLSN